MVATRLEEMLVENLAEVEDKDRALIGITLCDSGYKNIAEILQDAKRA